MHARKADNLNAGPKLQVIHFQGRVVSSGLHHDTTVRLLTGALSKKRSNFPKRTRRGHTVSRLALHIKFVIPCL
jgi:hypothetical protein